MENQKANNPQRLHSNKQQDEWEEGKEVWKQVCPPA